jgi:hypothetical protein
MHTEYYNTAMSINELALLIYICIHYVVYIVLQYQKTAAYDAE